MEYSVCLMLVSLFALSAASGVFELRVERFDNELRRDAEGHCCSGTKSPLNGRINECSGSCRTQIRVCLKHYQTSIDLSGPCTYGDFTTPVLFDNSGTANVSGVADDGYTVRLPFEFSWPVNLHSPHNTPYL